MDQRLTPLGWALRGEDERPGLSANGAGLEAQRSPSRAQVAPVPSQKPRLFFKNSCQGM